jgi:hypothetical protein
MSPVGIVVGHPAVGQGRQFGEASGIEEQRALFFLDSTEENFHLRVALESPQSIGQPDTIL